MVYERTAELRLRRPFLYQPGELRVVPNPFFFSRLRQYPGTETNEQHEKRRGDPRWPPVGRYNLSLLSRVHRVGRAGLVGKPTDPAYPPYLTYPARIQSL